MNDKAIAQAMRRDSHAMAQPNSDQIIGLYG
jgi:hypothetical protein